MDKKKLSLVNVSKTFTQAQTIVNVLSSASLDFEEGKTYALTGVSGTGKSTLLHMLAGIEAPTAGSIMFDGQDITTWPMAFRQSYLNKTIGLLFQDPYLIAELSVIENVMLKGMISGLSYDECYEQGVHLLSLVGLQEKADHFPQRLSGGEQQRVSLMRALFLQPVFFLADEPTAHLDQATKQLVMSVILSCQQRWGMGVIVATHDLSVASLCQTVYELKQGKLVAHAPNTAH